ncbi:MAG TPA: dephospho-CoA kinase [Acidobacteriota bacterium]|nr:dephospho-CoA kinase [Acidobacteriota bacterium]
MLHVGLTGNIATGKSCAAALFARLGARVIDADEVVHELMRPGGATYHKIVDTFGPQIRDDCGNIDRRRLAEIVFSDEEKRHLLNSISHPVVRDEIRRRTALMEKSTPGGILMVEAALMVETGGWRQYQRLVVVTCSPALQLSRLMKRNGLSESEAQARIASQMSIEEKIKLAHYVIDSSGSFAQTGRQVERIYGELVTEEERMCVKE